MILATSLADGSASVETPRRDELHAVGRAEIAERIVGGDDLRGGRRDFLDRGLHLPLERIELGEIGRGVGVVGGLAGGIGGAQPVADVGDIDLHIGDRLPGVRIGRRRDDGDRRSLRLARRTPRCATRSRALVPDALTSRVIQPSRPSPLTNTTLAAASVLASAGVGERHVGVAVRADQRRDLDPVAADVRARGRRGSRSRDGLELRALSLRGERECEPCQRVSPSEALAPRSARCAMRVGSEPREVACFDIAHASRWRRE